MINKKPISPEAALLRMADLCARTEYCRYEIAEKLRKLRLPYSDIEDILDYLEDHQYIDHSRFAHSFVNDKVRFSAWGRNKIKMYLIQKRIERDVISEALEDIDDTEYANALERAARAKLRSLDLNIREDKEKMYRHLAGRGFEATPVSSIIRRLKEEQEDNEEEEE